MTKIEYCEDGAQRDRVRDDVSKDGEGLSIIKHANVGNKDPHRRRRDRPPK